MKVNKTMMRLLGLFAAAAACLCASACSGASSVSQPEIPPNSPPSSSNAAPATTAYLWGFNAYTSWPQTVQTYQIGSATSSTSVSTLQLPLQSWGWALATDASGELYVGVSNVTGQQILVYGAGASGTATPNRVIDLPYTPQSLFVDGSGNLYVGSSGAQQNIVVSVYGPDASGQATPIRILQSANNEGLFDITVDTSGYLYVAGFPLYDSGNLPYSFIDVYAPDAEGSAEPVRSISFGVFICGIAVDGSGNVYASVESSLATGSSSPTSVAVEEFSPQANGYATPTSVVTLPQQPVPVGETGAGGVGGGPVRFDGAGNIYSPEITGNEGSFNYVLYKISPQGTSATPMAQVNPENGYNFFFAVN